MRFEDYVPSNYDAWNVEQFRWSSIAEFLDRSQWKDGIHTIRFGHGPDLDILLHGNPLKERTVPVFFNGAIGERENKRGPFFSGQRIAALAGVGFIAISDPSTNLHESLGLAWYAGSRDSPLQVELTKVLRGIAQNTNSELLLIGGSGGGFASLFYGHQLGDLASVFVWNPQTDIFRYNAQFVKNYLNIAFGLIFPEHGWEQLANAAELDTNFRVERSMPRRLVYMQNASDWHVGSHAAPFLSANEYENCDEGVFESDENHAVFIANYGLGHAALPEGVVRTGLISLMDPKNTAVDVVNLIKREHSNRSETAEKIQVNLEKELGYSFTSQNLS